MLSLAAWHAGRSVFQDVLVRFISSNEWRAWSRSDAGAELLAASTAGPLAEEALPPPEAPPPPSPKQLEKKAQWDGWD